MEIIEQQQQQQQPPQQPQQQSFESIICDIEREDINQQNDVLGRKIRLDCYKAPTVDCLEDIVIKVDNFIKESTRKEGEEEGERKATTSNLSAASDDNSTLLGKLFFSTKAAGNLFRIVAKRSIIGDSDKVVGVEYLVIVYHTRAWMRPSKMPHHRPEVNQFNNPSQQQQQLKRKVREDKTIIRDEEESVDEPAKKKPNYPATIFFDCIEEKREVVRVDGKKYEDEVAFKDVDELMDWYHFMRLRDFLTMSQTIIADRLFKSDNKQCTLQLGSAPKYLGDFLEEQNPDKCNTTYHKYMLSETRVRKEHLSYAEVYNYHFSANYSNKFLPPLHDSLWHGTVKTEMDGDIKHRYFIRYTNAIFHINTATKIVSVTLRFDVELIVLQPNLNKYIMVKA
ncbi:hypothetical protein DFA_07399 [Cavenderia fasciculata]|uniref:Uncharacterized protein n=1 Tax=Cavenderia fasciculata TaxID=261658 RepID=F4PWB2_CACFS|nr:uncharacterized protein DFA_07399 [Cavenderia fasciculata]EGG20276.1 hypothetical protein DFA_07399 [Cavenderia fasciculata]|eukprot:XP_004367259.1 hypothetical protein DFA_07399 [Cavenderia fasciculata]